MVQKIPPPQNSAAKPATGNSIPGKNQPNSNQLNSTVGSAVQLLNQHRARFSPSLATGEFFEDFNAVSC